MLYGINDLICRGRHEGTAFATLTGQQSMSKLNRLRVKQDAEVSNKGMLWNNIS
jgi:hypothetical protein